MRPGTLDDPRWVDAILDWKPTWLLARVALTSAYWLGGISKLADFPSAIVEQDHMGLHPAWAWACLTIAVELIGPALVISGRFVWLGAGMLGVFTGLAAIIANPFWSLHGAARFGAFNAFFEHLGLIAGFVIAARLSEIEQRKSQL